MYRYKRLLVGIEFRVNDETTIRYASMSSRLARSEKVYFVHVVRSLDSVPEYLRAEYSNSSEPVDEFIKHQMEKLVAKYFDGHCDTELEYEVTEDSPLLGLLRLIKQKGIDLVVMGRNRDPKEDLRLCIKLTRKASCSVLTVPGGAEPKLNNILVAVDFSEHSADAMEVGIACACAAGISRIQCLHVYHVPAGYQKTGKTYDEFGEIMKRNAEKDFQKFIANIDCKGISVTQDCKGISVTPTFKLEQHQTAKAIEETIEENNIDLVVMGTRGVGTFAGLLLGNVTKALIKRTAIPLVAVKRKGTVDVMEALINL
ncbi:MAG TPA: universal stress protein [Syntrophales bacterium]|nr:universal stress protein [Syntrophales bacterium]